jgi:hypothetical protein
MLRTLLAPACFSAQLSPCRLIVLELTATSVDLVCPSAWRPRSKACGQDIEVVVAEKLACLPAVRALRSINAVKHIVSEN